MKKPLSNDCGNLSTKACQFTAGHIVLLRRVHFLFTFYAIVVQFHSRGTVACVSMATLPAGKLIVVAFQYLITHTDTCVCVNTCLLC